jgi:hypothetical protein
MPGPVHSSATARTLARSSGAPARNRIRMRVPGCHLKSLSSAAFERPRADSGRITLQ